MPFAAQRVAVVSKTRQHLFVVLLFLCIINASVNLFAQNVLILHSYHRGYAWDDDIHSGIYSIFESHPEYSLHIEHLDSLRNTDPSYLDSTALFWKEKYSNRNFDLIIASDDPAVNFLNQYPFVFTNVPVVFCGVNNYYSGQFKNIPNVTGVNEEISISETLEVASVLRPNAKKLMIVADRSITGERNLALFWKHAQFWDDRLEIIEAVGLEEGELIRSLSTLSSQDIVLYLGYLITPLGKRFSVKESVSLVKKRSPAPVFGMWDFLLPHGIVGGHVVRGFSQGEAAALLALKVLKGENIASLPVIMKSPNRYMFNDRVLEHYSMDASSLPPDSQLIALRSSHLLKFWQNGAETNDFGYEMFEKHTSIMLLIDPETGIIIDANKSARTFYGYAQIVGMNISEINTLTPEEIAVEMAFAIESKKNYFQFTHRLADASIRHVHSYTGSVELQGQPLLFSIIQDVTYQVNATRREQSLRTMIYALVGLAMVFAVVLIFNLLTIAKNRRSTIFILSENERKIDEQNRLITTLLSHLPIGVFMVESPSGKALIANEKAKELLGRGVLPDANKENLQEVYSAYKESTGELYPPEQMPIIRAMFGQATTIDDMVVVRPDGSRTLLEVSGTPVYNSDNNVSMALVSFLDISERKKMENDLRESNIKLKTLFDVMTELVVMHELVFSSDGEPINYRITDCNTAFTTITGIRREQSVGRLATEVYGTALPPYLKEFAEVALTGSPYHYETYFPPMDKHFSISVVSPGKNRFATITTDISEAKRIQSVIDAKNRELEQIVYVASHDLRSPLVNVDGFSRELSYTIADLTKALEDSSSRKDFDETLKESFADMEQSISRIRTSAAQMDKLLAGLLNLSRSGRVALQIGDINMDTCINSLSSSFAFTLEQTGGKLIVEKLPPCRGDELQLTQVFSNLIDNAIKYRHPDRPPMIRISGSAEQSHVVYRVTDNGVGIAENHYEHVFELFHRLNPSQIPGEGLGLTSVRQTLSRMYGEIRLESEEGIGSTFIIHMPPVKEQQV